MKTIKSALLGTKKIIDSNPDALLFQLKEIIKEHRAIIITRLLGDLPTYLDYKFQVKANKELLLSVKEKLLSLKNSGINLDCYDSVVQQVMTKAVCHLTNEPFYVEIDEYLAPYVIARELKFGQLI